MEAFFTTKEVSLTRDALRWGEKKGKWRRIVTHVYRYGAHDPTPMEQAIALVLSRGGVASGLVAAVLLGLDAVWIKGSEVTIAPTLSNDRTRVRRRTLASGRTVVVNGVPCTDGLQTVIDLAATLDDKRWEQALESALRRRLLTVDELFKALPALGRSRVPGTRRIRRVLAGRPVDARPTESMLETVAVQLARLVPGLPPPVRQYEVHDRHGRFVARVDLAWPELGLFLELDGQHHLGQPVYDANRETAVVAATGWLCGRFTWEEIVHHPSATARRLAAVVEQARRRPVASPLPRVS